MSDDFISMDWMDVEFDKDRVVVDLEPKHEAHFWKGRLHHRETVHDSHWQIYWDRHLDEVAARNGYRRVKPSLITASRGSQLSELVVQPVFKHIVNLPIMGLISVPREELHNEHVVAYLSHRAFGKKPPNWVLPFPIKAEWTDSPRDNSLWLRFFRAKEHNAHVVEYLTVKTLGPEAALSLRTGRTKPLDLS